MAEISNTTLAVLVFAALVVVIGGTALNFMSTSGGLTGRLTSDTGNVSLSVSSTLAIQVDPGNNTINFGACTPRAGVSYWCATNDASICDGTQNNNCTGDTGATQFIAIMNVGNVDANVTISNNQCDAATLIRGTSPLFQYQTAACNGTGVGSWTNFVAGGQSNNICNNISFQGGKLQLYVNVTIPSNALGPAAPCNANNRTTITFSATQST